MPVPNEGLLAGRRVVELASELTAFAGRVLAGLGAEVVLVEPRAGHRARGYGPFAHDRVDPEQSLWWWYYNVAKLGVALDMDNAADRADLERLIDGADIVLEAEPCGRLSQLGINASQYPDVVWVSVAPVGDGGPEDGGDFTDLTLAARGGMVWSCGYDDHSIPPVRAGGDQAHHTTSLYAVLSALTALAARHRHGTGQRVDVSALAAVNVTTEVATTSWLVARETVSRQTGRHAAVRPTRPALCRTTDGRHVYTGFPPRTAAEFAAVLGWLADLALDDEFPDAALVRLAVELGGVDLAAVGEDDLQTEIYGAGRDAVVFIAAHLTAAEFFHGGQARGFACGIVQAPEDVLVDEHARHRSFFVDVEHDSLGRSYRYPGAPFVATQPWITFRAPRLNEHRSELLHRVTDRAAPD